MLPALFEWGDTTSLAGCFETLSAIVHQISRGNAFCGIWTVNHPNCVRDVHAHCLHMAASSVTTGVIVITIPARHKGASDTLEMFNYLAEVDMTMFLVVTLKAIPFMDSFE